MHRISGSSQGVGGRRNTMSRGLEIKKAWHLWGMARSQCIGNPWSGVGRRRGRKSQLGQGGSVDKANFYANDQVRRIMWRSDPASRDHPAHPSTPQAQHSGKKAQGGRAREGQEAGPRQSWPGAWKGLRNREKVGLEDPRGPSHPAFRGCD